MQITTIMKKIVNMADIGYYAVPLHMIYKVLFVKS